MWLKCCKYKQNRWFSSVDLDPLLGLILEVFWEPKRRPKPSKSHLKKTSKKWCPKWPQTGPKGGPQMEPKSSKVMSWKHLVSRVAPKRPPEPLQDRYWKGLGIILGPCWWFLHAFLSGMMQTKTFKRTRNHQNNTAESFQETASLRAILHWTVH